MLAAKRAALAILLASCSGPAPPECRLTHYTDLEVVSSCEAPLSELGWEDIECWNTRDIRDPETCHYEAFGYCEYQANFTLESSEVESTYYVIVRFRAAECENRYYYTTRQSARSGE